MAPRGCRVEGHDVGGYVFALDVESAFREELLETILEAADGARVNVVWATLIGDELHLQLSEKIPDELISRIFNRKVREIALKHPSTTKARESARLSRGSGPIFPPEE